ncbi:TetR/AcrR family transcriptional regulator [Pareuzebyella sediminis]|uniref:TetR/AcrR family transcriptional regulator n=1 Tax=Pareuzebyella sediminis TaxID=2607998 RepID=UPI0011F08FAB|nr:TetR/AcrR family transcriptional regulator [Pareuzebyella sediminis]
MDSLLQSITININDNIYLKDPESSDLGKRIIQESILMIDKMGFERFTFKKLAIQISSTESSVYRYFESKHKLLLYLTSWYWGWLEYRLVFATHSMEDIKQKLTKAIEMVTRATAEDSNFSHINEVLLNKIVINEFSKSYLTQEVDMENKNGYFAIYKRLVSRLGKMIQDFEPAYAYPFSLASTILEGSMHQHFLKEHFPSLTDCNDKTTPTQFLTDLVLNTLNRNTTHD